MSMILPQIMRRPDGRPVVTAEDRAICRADWLQTFADRMYGPIPVGPERLDFVREPIRGEAGERVIIDLTLAGSRFSVDAALWLPQERSGKVPLIIGLGFLGPIGVLSGDGFPIDDAAIIEKSVANTLRGGRLCDANRGQHKDRWPIASLLSAGYGVLLSCYGSWVPDHPSKWHKTRLGKAARSMPRTGAISLWAWAFQRLVDVGLRLDGVDAGAIVLAGHSRLGKAALWAGATDERVAVVLVNNSGCGGAALSCHRGGETLAKLRAHFPHWMVLDRKAAVDPRRLPVDQHHLIACMAPRAVYVASASEDHWADPVGEYMALCAASPFWGAGLTMPSPDTVMQPGRRVWSGNLAWHLRPGRHDMTPWDWRRFLEFLERRRRLETDPLGSDLPA